MHRRHASAYAAFAFAAFIVTIPAAAGEAPAEEAAPDIIRPEEVRRGMKGYALTVFEGTEPEPFEIEVVGRLVRALPQQDIILIRCTDPKLRDMRVASGMSGSPVYVRDPGGEGGRGKVRLMGALAYSWMFQLEAIAGVTPITNMLGEEEGLLRGGPALGRAPAEPEASGPAERRAEPILRSPVGGIGDGERDRTAPPLARGPFDYIAASADPLAYDRLRGTTLFAGSGVPVPGALTPVTTPLMVSGLPPGYLAELRRQLAPLGLVPVQGGGGGADMNEEAPGKDIKGFGPGDAIGVQLMRGDADWTAIGTVTHVSGKSVLAFGHPFIGAGPWEAPVTRADVQLIVKSSMSSFKLANSGPVVGKLVDDRQACIVAEIGGKAGMVPIEVEVTGEGRKGRTFRYEIVRHPLLSGMLASWAIVDSVHSAYPWRDDSTITVRQRIELEGYPALTVETVSSGGGGLGFSQITRPVSAALYNPFERVKLVRLSFHVNVEPRNRSARILSVRAEAPEVKPGTEVTLYVKIRPFGEEDTELPFTLRVPEEPRRGSFSVSFRSGGSVAPDIPMPRNLDEYLDAIRAHHTYSADELVAVHERRTRGLMTEGRVLPALPASVVNVLAPAGSDEGTTVADKARIVKKTRWVLKGSASISLVLRD